jgi:hypothetical protein
MDSNPESGPQGEIRENKELRASNASALHARQNLARLAVTNDVLRRFNRDAKRLATQALVAGASAILVLGLLIRKEEDALLNANPPTLSKVDDLHGNRPTDATTSGQEATTSDDTLAVISAQRETLVQSTAQTPAALTAELNQPGADARSLAHSQDQAPGNPPKVHNIKHRLFGRSRFIDVKMRLLALWHQSLERSQRAQTWTALSNKGEK